MDELIQYLHYNNKDFDPEWTELEIDFEIKPSDYLNYAHQDIEEGDSERAKVNAFSNAKRALHFQIDLLIDAFGIASSNRLSFPKKLILCEKIGISTPRILRKINLLRNKVEHDYFVPEKSEVEDAIDVVELFLDSTSRFFSRFPDNIIFPDGNAVVFGCTNIFNVKLIKGKGEIVLSMQDDDENYTEKSCFAPSDEFFAWLYFINHSAR